MVYRLFLDINILVDFLDPERDKHNDAVNLIKKIESGVCSGFVTESVLNTLAYLIRKDFSVKAIIELFDNFLKFFLLLPVYTTTYKSAIRHAVNDVEDVVLYEAALENSIDYFITNDVKDIKKIATASLPVKTAGELLKLL